MAPHRLMQLKSQQEAYATYGDEADQPPYSARGYGKMFLDYQFGKHTCKTITANGQNKMMSLMQSKQPQKTDMAGTGVTMKSHPGPRNPKKPDDIRLTDV